MAVCVTVLERGTPDFVSVDDLRDRLRMYADETDELDDRLMLVALEAAVEWVEGKVGYALSTHKYMIYGLTEVGAITVPAGAVIESVTPSQQYTTSPMLDRVKLSPSNPHWQEDTEIVYLLPVRGDFPRVIKDAILIEAHHRHENAGAVPVAVRSSVERSLDFVSNT